MIGREKVNAFIETLTIRLTNISSFSKKKECMKIKGRNIFNFLPAIIMNMLCRITIKRTSVKFTLHFNFKDSFIFGMSNIVY